MAFPESSKSNLSAELYRDLGRSTEEADDATTEREGTMNVGGEL
jgi:hypothetical protein